MATVVRMPEVLANVTEAVIQSWLVQPGERITVGAPLAEVETEKAVVEYASETEGTVLKLLVPEGRPVAVGDPIALIGAPGEADVEPQDTGSAPTAERAAPEPETAREREPSPLADAPTELTAGGPAGAGPRQFATPIVRRLARERGIDLTGVQGSGPGGRIVRVDLDRIATPTPTPTTTTLQAAEVAPSATSAETRTSGASDAPLSPMRRAIARRLSESKSTVPHFYISADLRADELLRLRNALNEVDGARVSVNDLVVKALAGALVDVPAANVVWAEQSIRRFSGVDIAIAVALEDGLVTPVLRGVDAMPLRTLAASTADLIARSKQGRLRQHELEGGVTTVSNLGMYGVREFSAIINPPQSTILAVGAASERAIVVDGALAVGTMMTLTLSVDHRVIDGATAAQLLTAVIGRLEQPVRLLL
jgi:pyruvate dehydrogenase E2 component (dihydrolipoamide acetyltransferase)